MQKPASVKLQVTVSPKIFDLLTQLSNKKQITKSAIIALAIDDLAQKEGVKEGSQLEF